MRRRRAAARPAASMAKASRAASSLSPLGWPSVADRARSSPRRRRPGCQASASGPRLQLDLPGQDHGLACHGRAPGHGRRAAGPAESAPCVRACGSRAGLPTATTSAGRSRTTTAPAPTTVRSPTVTPGPMITPPPSRAAADRDGMRQLPTTRSHGGIRRVRGRQQSWTFGPIWTSSPIVTVAQSSMTAPAFTKQRTDRDLGAVVAEEG